MPKEFYKILEVDQNSTQDEIKQSYKRLAKIHHPDKGGDKEVFQKIQTAYETLSDEQKRSQYDNPVQNMFNMGGRGGHPDVHSFFQGGGHPFDFMFRRNNMNKKVDHHYTLKISLIDVFTGLKKTLNIKHDIKCDNCNKKCESCNGLGNRKNVINMMGIQIVQEQPCGNCNGYGIIKTGVSCDICKNKGVNVKENIINILVPKGVDNGHQITFKNLGEQPKNENEIAGDFIVTIQIDEGVIFKRRGLDLVYERNISFKESIVGKDIIIPHFEKEFGININIFGIIDPNKEYIIYGKGLINEAGSKGNLLLKFEIDYNRKLTKEEIEKINNIL